MHSKVIREKIVRYGISSFLCFFDYFFETQAEVRSFYASSALALKLCINDTRIYHFFVDIKQPLIPSKTKILRR